MGAWDVGMLANDNAADTVSQYAKEIVAVLESRQKDAELFRTMTNKGVDSDGILGVAQVFLDFGHRLSDAAQVFLPTPLGAALLEVGEYTNPPLRAEALGSFAAEARGATVRNKGRYGNFTYTMPQLMEYAQETAQGKKRRKR